MFNVVQKFFGRPQKRKTLGSRTNLTIGDLFDETFFKLLDAKCKAAQTSRIDSTKPNLSNVPKAEPATEVKENSMVLPSIIHALPSFGQEIEDGYGGCSAGHEVYPDDDIWRD